MSLADIITEINKIKPYTTEDVDSGPSETLAGRRGRKMQAIDKLVQLKREYKQELLKTAAFIVVTGAEKENFSTLATEKAKCLAADPEEFYKDLSKRLAPAVLSGKQTMDNAFDVLGRHLEDKAIELDLMSYPQVIYRQKYASGSIKSQEQLTAVIKQAINDQMGSEIVGIQAISTLVNPAIDRGHKEKVTAILLPTDDLDLAKSLTKDLKRLTGNVFLILTGVEGESSDGTINVSEVNVKTVKATLTKIRDNLK